MEIHVLEEVQFGRDLGTTDDRGKGTGRGLEGLFECLQFRLHAAPRAGRQQRRQCRYRGVGAMGAGKGVVDIDVTKGSEIRRKLQIVLFFLCVEAEILEQQNFPILKPVRHFRRQRAVTFLCKLHRQSVEGARQGLGNGAK